MNISALIILVAFTVIAIIIFALRWFLHLRKEGRKLPNKKEKMTLIIEASVIYFICMLGFLVLFITSK